MLRQSRSLRRTEMKERQKERYFKVFHILHLKFAVKLQLFRILAKFCIEECEKT